MLEGIFINTPKRNGLAIGLLLSLVLITSLGIGELTYVRGGKSRHMSLCNGYAEVLPNRVSVLTEAGEPAEEIDVERATASRARAEKMLSEVRDTGDKAFREARAQLARAVSRISVARKQ